MTSKPSEKIIGNEKAGITEGVPDWDKRKAYTQSSLLQASGKSVGLYDRYYLPDSYMEDWYGEIDVENKVINALADYPGVE